MRYGIKVRFIERVLFHVEDDMKGGLLQLRGLEGLNVGKMFSCPTWTFAIFACWTSCPSQVGLYGINVFFPAVTLTLKTR